MRHPPPAMADAMARPIPRKPPVTTATFPWSFISASPAPRRTSRRGKSGLKRERPPFFRRAASGEHDVQHVTGMEGIVHRLNVVDDTIDEVRDALDPAVAVRHALGMFFDGPWTAELEQVNWGIVRHRVTRQRSGVTVHFQDLVAAGLNAPGDVQRGEQPPQS